MRQFLEYGRGLVGDHNHALTHALSLCSDAPLDLYQNIALDQERAFSVSVRLDTGPLRPNSPGPGRGTSRA